MTQQEDSRYIKVLIEHELIGKHTLDLSLKDTIAELRNHICENTAFYIFENFHFEHDGRQVTEYTEVGESFKTDMRLRIVLEPFNDHSSRHHFTRVKAVLAEPKIWSLVNFSENQSNYPMSEKDETCELDLQTAFDCQVGSTLLEPEYHQKDTNEFVGLLNSSGFNPAPNYRKMMGDFYYLVIKTPEDCEYHVTANPKGFFVNMSHSNHFNPSPNPKYNCCNSLLEIIGDLSPKFKARFEEVVKGIYVGEFQKMFGSFEGQKGKKVWMAEERRPSCAWKNERIEKRDKKHDFSSLKDWNEIFHLQKSHPADNTAERISKEKLKHKIHQEFTESAKEGAIKILDGEIKPISQHPDRESQVYIYSSLFFSFVRDYAEDRGKFVSSKQANVNILNQNELASLYSEGFSLSHKAIIKYRGFKILVQTLPPSILYQDSLRGNQTIKQFIAKLNQIQSDEQFSQILLKLCNILNISAEHSVVNDKGGVVKVIGHPEIKGVMGSNNHRYIVNLMRLSPRDLNFIGDEHVEDVLRPELVRLFNSRHKCSITINTLIGTNYKYVSSEKTQIEEGKLLALAKFAKEVMVPACIESFQGPMRKYLADSCNVMYVLHKHGLSSKYLEYIYKRADEREYGHIKLMMQRVIFVKSLKNVFRIAMAATSLVSIRPLLAYLLNCIFCADLMEVPEEKNDETECEVSNISKKKKKKGKDREELLAQISLPQDKNKFLSMSCQEVWEEVIAMAKKKFMHTLAVPNGETGVFALKCAKHAILRDLCLSLGIVMEKREYFGDFFRQDNVQSIEPICKFSESSSKELDMLIEEGDRMIGKFHVEEAIEAYNRVIQYIFSHFGGANEKLGIINKKFSSIYYKIGDIDTAVLFAEQSCQIFEVIYEVENIETLQSYALLGLYYYAQRRYGKAQKFLLKAILIATRTYSQAYPEILLILFNLSTVYETQRKYADAIMCLFSAYNTCLKVFGQANLNTAISLAALAALHYEIPDIAQAIKYQSSVVRILEDLLGSGNPRVGQARGVLESYRNLQSSKKIREIHEKEQKNYLNSQMYGCMPIFRAPQFQCRGNRPEMMWGQRGRRMKYFI